MAGRDHGARVPRPREHRRQRRRAHGARGGPRSLLAVAELAYWSLELRGPVVDESGTYLRRIALLATLVLGVVGLGAIMLTLVEIVEAGGIAVDILGAAAALGALALLAAAARRAS